MINLLNIFQDNSKLDFFRGNFTEDGDSRGHYICDVLDKLSNRWFRTNDNKIPKCINLKNVSKQAYVVLYRKKDN